MAKRLKPRDSSDTQRARSAAATTASDLARIERKIDHLTDRLDGIAGVGLRLAIKDINVNPPTEDASLVDAAVMLARRHGTVSATLLMGWFRIGYSRASRLLAEMERRGIVAARSSSDDDDQEAA